MKRLLYLLLMLILLLSSGCSCGSDTKWTRERYYSLCLNSNEKQKKSNTEYIYRCRSGINQYLFEKEKQEKLVTNANIRSYIIDGNYLYYEEGVNETECRLIRKKLDTGTETLIYKAQGVIHEYSTFDYKIFGDYIIYGNNFEKTYIGLKTGNLEENRIDTDTLFDEEDKSGRKQIAEYGGMVICRYYDRDNNCYTVEYVREKDTENSLMYDIGRYPENSIRYSDRILIFNQHEAEYWFEGDDKKHTLSCYENSNPYYVTFFSEYFVIEEDDIVGLVQKTKYRYRNSFGNYQKALKNESLFRLNPVTGESSIIFQTKNEYTRIIGYEAGEVYLFEDFKVYRQRLDSKEREELFTLPENDEYICDWQGDYLIVRYGGAKQNYAVAEAYKVK